MDSSRYVALDASKGVRDQKLAAWATLYIRFRDQSGEFIFQHAYAECGYWPQCLPLLHLYLHVLKRRPTPIGTLQDVEVTEPSIDDDEDPQSQSQGAKGKGRA